MEAKLMVNLIITANDFEKTEDGKMSIIDGYFYFQNQKYVIKNKEIYHAQGVNNEKTISA